MKNNWIYILITQPKVYLYSLLTNTFIVGSITLILNYVYLHSRFADMRVPVTAHSLIGFALGLLLVFRTSSAYERWSTANNNFNNIKNSLLFICMKYNCYYNFSIYKEQLTQLIIKFSDNFRNYLKSDCVKDERKFEKEYLYALSNMMLFTTEIERQTKFFDKGDTLLIQKSIAEIINNCGSCSKIKNTPIPLSYTMHIKVSIMIYILSLPFGLFADMGIWATCMVMIIYYVIAGIEIISKEIENPFFGDPNDLPVDEHIEEFKRIVNDYIDCNKSKHQENMEQQMNF